MKVTNTFAAILTIALTTGINIVNVKVYAAPLNLQSIEENRIENIENNNKSDKNTKPSQQGSQGGKCFWNSSGC